MSPTLSLHARLTLAAAIALLLFLGLTGFVLDRAFSRALTQGVQERLAGNVYALLAVIDFDPSGDLLVPTELPDPRLNRPGSDLCAVARSDKHYWQSPSCLGLGAMSQTPLAGGESLFTPKLVAAERNWFSFGQAVVWELDSETEAVLQIWVFQDDLAYQAQLRSFRGSLWRWLGGAALLLVVVQIAVLRWSLRPLRRLVGEVARVESGEVQQLEGRFPRELQALTANLNALISSERLQRERYRHSLADLAHSIKTPLAVARSVLDQIETAEVRERIDEQISRMVGIVEHQLKRAVQRGPAVLGQRLVVREVADPLVAAMNKLFSERDLNIESNVTQDSFFYGDVGDLQEIIGNLLENGCKWACTMVRLQVSRLGAADARRSGLHILVEDDGPGFGSDEERLLQRGIRGDQRVIGQGIGLAVVSDIVSAYNGAVTLGRSELGGARVSVRFASS